MASTLLSVEAFRKHYYHKQSAMVREAEEAIQKIRRAVSHSPVSEQQPMIRRKKRVKCLLLFAEV
jgi:hypothetical protein